MLPNIWEVNNFDNFLSIIALSCGMPYTMWALLASMGVLFSKTWTVRLVKEIGDEIARCEIKDSSKAVGFRVADNKSYLESVEFVHAEGVAGAAEEPLRANGSFFHTVNNLYVPITMPNGVDITIRKGMFEVIEVNNFVISTRRFILLFM